MCNTNGIFKADSARTESPVESGLSSHENRSVSECLPVTLSKRVHAQSLAYYTRLSVSTFLALLCVVETGSTGIRRIKEILQTIIRMVRRASIG